ncbi:MAG: TolC family protein [Armatimonadota bacterium]|nr:TolC family protein [bacterium]
MKKFIPTLLISLICISGAWAQQCKPEPPHPPELDKCINLDQALELAFRYNPNIKIAVDQLQRSRGSVNEARAAFNPKFSAVGQHSRQTEVIIDLGGGTNLTFQKPISNEGWLTMALPLDVNKQLGYTRDIAKYQFDIQYLSLLSVSEDLILSVKTAYYDLLRACGQKDVAQAAVDVAQTRLDNTTARFNAGTVAKFDVTTAQTDLANLNQSLIQAQNRVLVAQAALNRVLGVDVNIPTQIVKETPAIQGVPVDVPAAIETAYAKRPEVIAQETVIKAREKGIRLEKSAYYPTLSLSSSYGYTFATTGLNTGTPEYQTALTANIPIWNGGITRARVEQAQADFQNAQDTLDQTQLAVSLDVRTAALTLEEAAKRVSTTQQNVDLAEEALRLANVRYDAGIAILVEVTNAESQLTQARFNNVNAQYDYATAQAQLQRATSCIPELERLALLNPVETKP